MFSFPFELNKKVKVWGLQISDAALLSYFPPSGGFYKKHIDSGWGNEDTGRKFSCIYYVQKKNAKEKMLMEIDKEESEVEVVKNRMIIVKSRKAVYEYPMSNNKKFVINFYILGPIVGGILS